MNKIYCSTGALVGRVCGYDYSLISKHLPKLFVEGTIDGMEFMMIPFYYDVLKKVTNTVAECKVPAPIIHCEKDVGVLLSDWSPSVKMSRNERTLPSYSQTSLGESIFLYFLKNLSIALAQH